MPSAFSSPPNRTRINLFNDADFARQRAFFAARADLAPTPLHSMPSLARDLGLGTLLVKDETGRFGLNAFKSAGALFATATLRERGDIRPGDTLVCASEGNHGRAVARAARDLDCDARVYMANSAADVRKKAIQSEGAAVVSVAGTYDDAVRVMTREAAANQWTVISDTSFDEQDEIPRLIMLGYTRLMDEAESSWSPGPPPDVIFVQGGVGGLLAAVACWSDWRFQSGAPSIVSVEPTTAACLLVSARKRAPTTLKGPFDTIMAGLRAGEVSRAGFPAVQTIVDAFVSIEDEWALEGIRALARPRGQDPRIRAGASGAAGLGGLMATMRDRELTDLRADLKLRSSSRVMVIVTEGVTDPAVFERAVSVR